MTPIETVEQQIHDLLAPQPTRDLLEQLLLLEKVQHRTPDQRMARSYLLEEIESRYDVEEPMRRWAEDLTTNVSYTQHLINHLPKEAFL